VKILLVEDEKITRITLSNTLRKEGYDVVACEDGLTGISAIKAQSFQVVITDLRLPGASGLEVLKTASELQPQCAVMIITAYASVDTAVEALKSGAFDYLTKPFSPETLLARLRNLNKLNEVVHENERLKTRIRSFEKRVIIGESDTTRNMLHLIHLAADREATVLIEGESGTGKELVARALHHFSNRSAAPFVPINCAAIPESLFESELFGHEKGSFSGAQQQHHGYFERAHTGTIFIDDIDDFPLNLQVKLLRVLQEREFERVGGSRPVSVNIRVIAASKVSLWEMVQKKLFREDLYYRLNIIPIQVPTLRQRLDDIPLLVEHFLEKYNADPVARNKAASMMNLFNQALWPGNIRQLENIVQRICALPEMPEDILFPRQQERALPDKNTRNEKEKEDTVFPAYREYTEQKDREILLWALKTSHFNTSHAAKLLELPRSTLRSKMQKYGIEE
jgi:DNA-binding NtrC family response regulator